MTLLRRHIWAILVYLLGILLLGFALLLVFLYLHPPEWVFEVLLALGTLVGYLAPLAVVWALFTGGPTSA